jgi:soluble lytic murein transglycosylase-like protein
MAYVAGLYTKASQASADEAKRFRDFQTQIDEMGARERAGLMRQQQAAMDRQMAGLVQPGQLYTPETLPRVSPAGTSVATSPLPAMMPEQQIQPELTAPAGAAPASTAGLTPFRMSPGPIEAGGTLPAESIPGGGGFTPKPEASVIGNVAGEYGASQRATIEYNRLRGSLMTNVFGDVGSWFGSQADYDKRQQMKAAQTEALNWYESTAVKDFMLANPVALTEAQQDPIRYFVRNKDKLGKKAAAGAAAAPAEQPAPGGTQPIPAPTSTGIAPLEVPAAVPVKDEAFATQSAVKLENEFLPRVAEVPQMMTSDTVQRLVRRATELGVDPAAAVAIYGVETNFGRRVGVSEKGARGLMQVIPATFNGMKTFFTDPAEIKRYNIPQSLVDAAKNMSADDENSFDAGLLRMKYAEYKGVANNLLGAGYNASAETIAKLGRPLATGSGITNEDYNKAYIAIYNEARNYVGLEPNAQMANYEATAPLRLQEIDTNEQLELTNYNNEIGLLQTQNERILAQRNVIAQQIAFAQQSGFANRIPALQQQLLQIDDLLMQVTQQANQLNAGYQTKFNEFNMQRTTEFSNVAIGRMLRGDPRSLSEQWSRAYGEPVTIQRRSDGKYNIFMGADGRRMSPAAGMTPDEVATQFKMEFDSAFRAQEAERRQAERDAAVQHDRKLQELMIQQVGDIEVAKINKAPVPGFSKPEPVRYDPETGVAIEFISQGEGAYAGEIMRIKSPPQQELKDGILTIDQAIITRERRPGPQ